MIRKLVHFSDLHIRILKHHDLYREIIGDMLSKFREIKPDRIVFTGDLVHSKNQVSPELIEMVIWVLTECSKISKTVLIPGNHDFLKSNLERLDTLTPIIQALNNPNIVYYKDTGVFEDENVSWCVFSQFHGNVPPEIHEGKGVRIGLFHDPIQGLKTDLGYDFGDHGYDITKFNGLHIVLCGDIHKRQVLETESYIELPNESSLNEYLRKGWNQVETTAFGKIKMKKKIKVIQIGSPIQQNFGESVYNHGFGIYDVENDTYDFVDIENKNPFLSFRINSIDDIETENERLVNS